MSSVFDTPTFGEIAIRIGRVTAVNGSQSTVEIEAGAPTGGEAPTVGRFMGSDRRPKPSSSA